MENRPSEPQTMTDEYVSLHLGDGASMRMDRARRETVLSYAQPPAPAAFVHPILASTAAVWAEWNEMLAFHAGAFADRSGRVWGVLGERGQGKSTTMAWLASRGLPVVSDDMVVTDGDQVLAGPRCVDLREEAASHYRLGTDLGVVGARRRWRVALPDVPPSTPLAGWLVLSWGEATSLVNVEANDRVGRLAKARALQVAQQHPLPWLRVMTKPMFLFERPRRWERLDSSMEFLVATLSSG
jgi:hypothetical protein